LIGWLGLAWVCERLERMGIKRWRAIGLLCIAVAVILLVVLMFKA
jgi:hypothetical protein